MTQSNSNQGSVIPRGVGRGGKGWAEGSRGKGHMYTYD